MKRSSAWHAGGLGTLLLLGAPTQSQWHRIGTEKRAPLRSGTGLCGVGCAAPAGVTTGGPAAAARRAGRPRGGPSRRCGQSWGTVTGPDEALHVGTCAAVASPTQRARPPGVGQSGPARSAGHEGPLSSTERHSQRPRPTDGEVASGLQRRAKRQQWTEPQGRAQATPSQRQQPACPTARTSRRQLGDEALAPGLCQVGGL